MNKFVCWFQCRQCVPKGDLRTLMVTLMSLLLGGLSMTAYASGGGNDILGNALGDLDATMSSSIKHILYLCEGIMSSAIYIKTKNLLVLGGFVVIVLFTNMVFKYAGVA